MLHEVLFYVHFSTSARLKKMHLITTLFKFPLIFLLFFLAKSQTAEMTCNNQNKVIYLFTGIFGCKIKWYILINVEVCHYKLRMGPW